MSNYDHNAPSTLIDLQHWFGAVIGTPIDAANATIATPFTAETASHISPNHSLEPLQRIEVYNQQYWWRLLNALNENFPLLTRLFGTEDFNETIGKPALKQFPPAHWCLSRLGEELVQWVTAHYTAPDRNLVLDVARLDWSITSAMTAANLPPLSPDQINEQLADSQLALQPHLTLHHFRADLIAFRETLLEREPNGWLGASLPRLDKSGNHHYAVYRTTKQKISFSKLDPAEYQILIDLRDGHPLTKACTNLPEKCEAQLPLWCQQWTARSWLSVTK